MPVVVGVGIPCVNVIVANVQDWHGLVVVVVGVVVAKNVIFHDINCLHYTCSTHTAQRWTKFSEPNEQNKL